MGLRSSKQKADITTPTKEKKVKRRKSKKETANGDTGIEEIGIQETKEETITVPKGETAENEKVPEAESSKKADTDSTGSGNAPTDIVEDSPDKETQKVAQLAEVQSPSESSVSPVENVAVDAKQENVGATKTEATVESVSVPPASDEEVKKSETVTPTEPEKVVEQSPAGEPKAESAEQVNVVESQPPPPVPEPVVAETKVDPVPETKPEQVPEPEKVVETKTEQVSEPQTPVEAKSEHVSEPQTPVEAKPEQEPVAQPAVETKPEQVSESQPTVDAKPEEVFKPEPVVEQVKPEQVCEQLPVDETKAEPQEAETKQEQVSEPQPLAESQPEKSAEPEPIIEAAPCSDSVGDVKVEAQEPVTVPEVKSEVNAEVDGQVESKPSTVLEPEVVVETKAAQDVEASPASPVEEKHESVSEVKSPSVEMPESPAVPEAKTEIAVAEQNGTIEHVQETAETEKEQVSQVETLPTVQVVALDVQSPTLSKSEDPECLKEPVLNSPVANHIEEQQQVNGTEIEDTQVTTPTKENSNSEVNGQPPENGPSDIPTLISWKHGGQEVAVCGDFCKWGDNCSLSNIDGVFSTKIKLSKGQHHIKFFVDGKWTVDETEPIVELEGHGQVNLLSVGAGAE